MECPAGKAGVLYVSSIGNAQCNCHPCPAGTFKGATGTACSTCEPGEFSWPGSTACESCPSSSGGKANSVAGSDRSGCLCEAGSYGNINFDNSPSAPPYRQIAPLSEIPAFTDAELQASVVVVVDVLFPSSPSNGVLFRVGDAAECLLATVRSNAQVLRVRAGHLATTTLNWITSSATPYATLAYVDITDFPKDGKTHSLAIRFEKPRTLMVFIDGLFKGEGRANADMNRWAGPAVGGYGNISSPNPRFEPSENWQPALAANIAFHRTVDFPQQACLPCAQHTFKDVNGSIACASCPRNSGSAPGSASCQCKNGFKRKNHLQMNEGCHIRVPSDAAHNKGFRQEMC